MSTPASPVSTATAIKPAVSIPPASTLSKDWTWITSHLAAVLIVVSLIAASVAGSVYFVENLEAQHEAKIAALYSSAAADRAQQTQQFEQQLATQEANWESQQTQLLAQNSKLASEVSQQNQKLAQQVKTDATLDAQQAASKLAQQTQANAGEVVAQENDVNISLPVARRVVSDIDTLGVVQSNLADTQTQLTNETTVATNAQQDANSKQQIIVSQAATITDNQKACAAEVKEANAKVKKAGIKGFLYGAAATAVAIGIHLL